MAPGLLKAQQYYKNSVGLRLGRTSAITYKIFYNKQQALEMMVSGRNQGLQFTAMYQFHKPMTISFNDNFFAWFKHEFQQRLQFECAQLQFECQ